MTAYPHIAARLFDTAHAIEPNAFRTILEGPIARRILAGQSIDAGDAKKTKAKLPKAAASRLSAIVDCEPVMVAGGVAEFGLTEGGIAILPVAGILSRRFDWLTALCGWTTYEGLSAAFEQMMADSRVRAVLMDVESPGGEAAGMLDICDKILAYRNVKPIWAVANPYAASAAYGVAGSAERLLLPRLGQLGSIGAVRVHVDQSAYDTAGGEKYTAIYSGDRKIDGWGHAPLSEGAAKVYQADVDNCRQQFAELIGRQGRMTTKQALDTQAAMAADTAAVSQKYGDAIATFDEALAELTEFAAERSRSSSAAASAGQLGGQQPMTTTPAAAAAATPPASAAQPSADAPAPAAAAAAPEAKTEADDDKGDECPTCKGSGKKTAAETPAPAAHAVAPAAAAAAAEVPTAPVYTVEMAAETLELCTLAGVPAATARTFVDAKMPIAKVRSQLAASRAEAGDAPQIDPTAPVKSVTAGWDEAIAAANKNIPTAAKK